MEPAQTTPVAAPVGTERPSLWLRLRDRDHTRGSLFVSLLTLALPSMLTMVMGGAIYQLFDLKFVGALGPTAVAVVGVTNQTLRQLPFLAVMGLGIGSQMLIARLVGEGRVGGAEHVAGQALILGGGLWLVFAALGGLFPEVLLGLFSQDPDAIAEGAIYVRLVFLVMFGQIFVQLFVSILAGAGETTTPMLIAFCGTPIMIFAEWCLIFGHFGLPAFGISGVALGVGVGAIVSLGISLWVLFTGRSRVHVRRRHLLPDPVMLRRLLGTSWQPAMHFLARTLMVMFFMWLGGQLGTRVQAAYTIGLRIEMVAFMVSFPIANSCATLVSQNLGAGNLSRAWRSIGVGISLEIALLWMFSAGLLLFRAKVVAFFTDDPQVIALASEYLFYSAIGFSFYGVYFIAFRSLQAAGDMVSPMLISIGTASLLGAPLAFFLATRTPLGPTGMWVASLCYGGVNTMLTVGWLLRGGWTRRPLPTPIADSPRSDTGL